MPYLTPNTIPSGTFCRTVLIPDDLDWLVIVSGALSALCDPANFEQFGSVTPEEAAERFCEMFVEFRDSECASMTPVGATMLWHMPDPPDRWLICDGSGWLKSEYPALYALFGGKYGESPTFFGVPDLRSRIPYGADFDIELDEAFGAATHTLATTELPSHTHQTRIVTSGAAGANNALVVTQANVTTTPTLNTSNPTGGGAAHNNMPPVRGVNFIVYAGA